MFCVYVLYSLSSGRTYTGFTNNLERRLFEHNVSEKRRYTLRYRPWEVIYNELFQTKEEAMKREKFLKSGKGREEVKIIVDSYLNRVRYPPEAEKD